MRTLKKNKQNLYYSLFSGEEPVYELDENGDVKYMHVDGVGDIPVETGDTRISYTVPVPFKGNIATSGGESEAVEFGLSTADYSAILVVGKGLLPIDETSLIWYESEPLMRSDGSVDESSADYIIVKPSPSLNGVRYALKKVVK